MSMAHLARRDGLVHPSVNAHGTDSIGYTTEQDCLKGYRFSNSCVASQKVTEWHHHYVDAVKDLRRLEAAAWKGEEVPK